jgi:hypothetical protein
MEDGSLWGALLVAWLLFVPIVGAVISARWGGDETAARVGVGAHAGRTLHDNASVPPERVDYAPTSGERAIAGTSMRDRDIRDPDGRGLPRH